MKNALLLLATALLFIANACQKNNPLTDTNFEILESQRIRAYLTDTYGFSPESIEETADAFIVEGDQVFPKANFWEDYGMSSPNEFFVSAAHEEGTASDRKHYRSSYLVTSTSKTIILNVHSSVPSKWRLAIAAALVEWNALDGKFKFEGMNSDNLVDGAINFRMHDLLDHDVVAQGKYPTSNGKPGDQILINSQHNYLLHSRKIFAMIHEIGHNIGLRHTDEGLGALITNVSNTCKNHGDPNSVMQPYVDIWDDFTTCDKEAYEALYPH
ncbi:MAG: M57 family metalloprotease [Saprospiraceae bacterium]